MKLDILRKRIEREDKFPFLLLDLVNIRYLTGFKGSSAFLLMDAERDYFISDSRYEEYARSIIPPEMEFVLMRGTAVKTISRIMKRRRRARLFMEDHSTTLSQYSAYKKALYPVELIEGGSPVNELRMEKEPGEIETIREAVTLADRCFKHILSIVKAGMLEWDLSVEIEYFYRKNGCRKTAFDSIVASGAGSSMPHYITSMTKKIENGDALLIDMGCEYEGYNSDLTRTVFINSVDEDLNKIYGIVKEAQELAIEAVRPGISCGALDSVARGLIAAAGYGDAFGHSLGHGVGMEVHEIPAIKSGGRTKLRKNTVITVEPGIYIPGKGGVRIEDVVLVTDGGSEILTKSSKDIHIV
ncbi:MAG: aminopeptidase P family protein [Spirochaetales bacterium]|nr:MAG: aminopeptidase P family protein [Spirochaetales bacterium]